MHMNIVDSQQTSRGYVAARQAQEDAERQAIAQAQDGCNCCGCGAMLSGGVDTFGPADCPLCVTCFQAGWHLRYQTDEVLHLEDLIQAIDETVRELATQRNELSERIYKLQAQRRGLRAQLRKVMA